MNLVVTGSSSGIGRALVLRLLAGGHRVWGLARSDQSSLVAQHPGAFFASRCDVSAWNDIEAATRPIAESLGQLDGLVTCAGTQGTIGRTSTVDAQAWSATVRANLDGTFFAVRALWPLLVPARRRAKIVCFSGGGATKARANFSAYGAAKTAIVRLVETIAEEERAEPLDINAVAPGAIFTAMTAEVLRLGPDAVGREEYATALKQQAEPGGAMERALDLVEWLLSPASDGISGRLISAPWDPWPNLERHRERLAGSEVYRLRRITPEDRGISLP